MGACVRRTARVTVDRRRNFTCASGSVAFYTRVRVTNATANGGDLPVTVRSPSSAAACSRAT
jgi:hypothetical protein